jgi:membrane AbrB-like protein
MDSTGPLRRSALALIVCLAGAALFVSLGTVLPWMLGSLVAMAAASMVGLPVARPPGGLPAGQLVIGAALGLYFTRPVLDQLVHYAPYILAGAIFAFVLGTVCALVLARLSGCDFHTAFFASLPGGAAEMSILADRLGGRADWVAAAHALRIMLVVLTVPPLITWSGVHGSEHWISSVGEVHYAGLAVMAMITCSAALALRAFKMPNGWVIGPLLAMIALTGFGVELSALPRWTVNAAQLLIGCALGSRFNAGFFRAAPRFLASVAVTVYVAIALAAVFACMLAAVSGINVPTAILATAPGGVAEMSITAKVLQFGVPIVTAFHVTRMAFLVLTAGPLFSLRQRYLLRRAAVAER